MRIVKCSASCRTILSVIAWNIEKSWICERGIGILDWISYSFRFRMHWVRFRAFEDSRCIQLIYLPCFSGSGPKHTTRIRCYFYVYLIFAQKAHVVIAELTFFIHSEFSYMLDHTTCIPSAITGGNIMGSRSIKSRSHFFGLLFSPATTEIPKASFFVAVIILWAWTFMSYIIQKVCLITFFGKVTAEFVIGRCEVFIIQVMN